MYKSEILIIIIDYIPEDKLKKITAYHICEWCKFLHGFGVQNWSDVYTYLDAKLKLIDE